MTCVFLAKALNKEEIPISFKRHHSRSLKSIETHLKRLLNCRQGSLPHIPGFGIVDLNSLITSLPASIPELCHSIKNCIAHYEPRLSHLHILETEYSQVNARLDIAIQAKTRGGDNLYFDTELNHQDGVKVSVSKN
jgi:type VI secretion system protein